MTRVRFRAIRRGMKKQSEAAAGLWATEILKDDYVMRKHTVTGQIIQLKRLHPGRWRWLRFETAADMYSETAMASGYGEHSTQAFARACQPRKRAVHPDESCQINVKVAGRELLAWRAASEAKGLSMSEAVRMAMNYFATTVPKAE